MSKPSSSIFLSPSERSGKPKELFFIWFASNIGILGVVYGTMIVGFSLSFFQSLLAAMLGSLSFILVGLTSISGKNTGANMLTLSRAAFGRKGNYFPTLMVWMSFVGWLAVNVITGTLTLLSLLNIWGLNTTSLLTVVSLFAFSLLVLLSNLFSQKVLVKAQTIFTYVFGLLTLLVIALLIPKTNWQALFQINNGDWLTSFLPAVSIIIAGTGIGWVGAGADYSRYQHPKTSSQSVVMSVTLGAFFPLFIIMSAGILMTTSVPSLGTADNPINVISQALPSWMTALYFLTALGGLIPQCILSLKSARTNLQTLDIHVKDSTAVFIHAIIIIALPVYVLFFSQNFLGDFQVFLGLVGIGLASWGATFLVDFALVRRKFGYDEKLLSNKAEAINPAGLLSWLIGIAAGLAFTNTSFFTGPFARGIFEDSSLGVLLAFIVSGVVQAVLVNVQSSKSRGVESGKMAK
ncbi:purine-cytosine permease family protein [Priestia endophytica]|jgi:nucleobase:cation symporter-1, NCS1 family|uniref:purine-cytosine permease family protein n=1 Tax=Priestia endophytica TaxID=135735 RepID=UPI000DCA6E56|nr:cytosine permease [Priestia endophytica]RAS79085.1 allantoin permease [Priestia endophytica]